jgi:hypothetical protein
MKLSILVVFSFLLIWSNNCIAQNTIQVVTQKDIYEPRPLFQKGTIHQDLIPNLTFNSWKSDESEPTKHSQFSTNIRGNYFVADNIGVVAGVHILSKSEKQGDNLDSESSYLVEVGAQYGRTFGKIPLMAELTGALGSRTTKDEFSGSDPLINSTGLSALQFNVSTFLPLGGEGTYVRPILGYGTLSQKSNSSKTCTNGLFMGATLVRPMTCEDYICGFGGDSPSGRYDQGTNYVQFVQAGGFAVGHQLTQFDDDLFNDIELNANSYTLRFADYYYGFDNVAFGLGFDLSGQTVTDQNNDIKFTNPSFEIMPMVRGHLPMDGALNDAFVEVGGIFGSQSSKYNDNLSKQSIAGWEVGLGYNWAISDHLFVTTIYNYAGRTFTDNDTDVKVTRNGSNILVGFTHDLF